MLSIAEYKQCRENISPIENWWWLRSQGRFKSFATYVYPDGDVNEYGCPIYFTRGHIRPTLVVEDAPSVGSHFYFGGVSWTMISPCLALADKSLGIIEPSRRGTYVNDRPTFTYDFETSELREYLDSWLDAARIKAAAKCTNPGDDDCKRSAERREEGNETGID